MSVNGNPSTPRQTVSGAFAAPAIFDLGRKCSEVEVVSLDGADIIGFAINTMPSSLSPDPEVGGEYYLLPATICSRRVPVRESGNTRVYVWADTPTATDVQVIGR